MRLHGKNAKLNFPNHTESLQLSPVHIHPGFRSKRSTCKGIIKKDGGEVQKKIGNSGHTLSQNIGNMTNGKAQRTKGTSQFRGVSWNSSSSKWRAQVGKGSDVHHLGYFENEIDAARAYDAAVIRIRAPDAPTNFPRSDYNMSGKVNRDGHGDTVVPVKEDNFSHLSRFPSISKSAEKIQRLKTGAEKFGPLVDVPLRERLSSRFLDASCSCQNNAWAAEIWNEANYKHLGIPEIKEKCLAAETEYEGQNVPMAQFDSPREAISGRGIVSTAINDHERQNSGIILLNLLGKKLTDDSQEGSAFIMNERINYVGHGLSNSVICHKLGISGLNEYPKPLQNFMQDEHCATTYISKILAQKT